MALHKNTANAASTLARLRASQASLELMAKQLAARKSDVEAKADHLGRSLQRTIDTREKIVLGALVKMVQLDRFTLCGRNDNKTTTIGVHNTNVMAKLYDLDLIVGALLTVSEKLENDTTTFGELRKRGAEFRSQSKIDRVVKMRSS